MNATNTLVPRLLVFDLDACVWSPEMYLLHSPPSAYDAEAGGVRAGQQVVRLFPGAQAVLRRIATEAAWAEVTVAAASSTTEPQWADTVMQLMRITPEGVTMAQRFSHNQVYPIHNKVKHFEALQAATGVPYDQMVFFDDCTYGDNCRQVERGCPGVTTMRTPFGLTEELFDEAMRVFATRC